MTYTHDSEEWKPVPVNGYEDNYEVSNLGRIRRSKPGNWGQYPAGMIIHVKPNARGYSQVCLKNNGRAKGVRVARLVLEAFTGPPPEPYYHAAHNDGVPTNNCLSNLRWATPVENQADRLKHNTYLRGEEVGNSKLEEFQVIEMRSLYSTGDISLNNLARRYGINKKTVLDIVKRKWWKHI